MRKRQRQGGQMLVLAVLLIPILLGMSAMAVDLGSYASERRSLQNAADSIALAAARSLPNAAAADTAGNQWAAKNGISLADLTMTVTGGTTAPTVHVVIQKSHSFAFIKILGIDSSSIGAKATAAKFSLGAQPGIVPWGVTQAALNGAAPGTSVTLKYDANNPSNGNFGAIDLDGNGSNVYQDGVTYGSTSAGCAAVAALCTTSACTSGAYPTACAENSSSCVGPDCVPETGNKIGATRDAVNFRIAYTSLACDTFDEVFTPLTSVGDLPADSADRLVVASAFFNGDGRVPPPHYAPSFVQPTKTPKPTSTPKSTSTAIPSATPTRTSTPVTPTSTPGGSTATPTKTATPGTPTIVPTATPGGTKYALNQNCNPWAAGGLCPPAPSTALCSRRVLIVPIINGFGNGSSTNVTIQQFALFFLEGFGGGGCTGNNCEVLGRFVNADLTTGALAGTYSESSPVQFIKLIE